MLSAYVRAFRSHCLVKARTDGSNASSYRKLVQVWRANLNMSTTVHGLCNKQLAGGVAKESLAHNSVCGNLQVSSNLRAWQR